MIPRPGRLARVGCPAWKYIALASVGWMLAGCAALAPPAPGPPAPEWGSAELMESLNRRAGQFRSLRALAQVSYAGPEGRHGFQEAVVIERPNRLRLETLSYLGAILIVTVNDREIIGYHPRDGVFVRGPGTKENLLRYTQIPLNLDEITSLLAGLPPVDLSAQWTQEGNTLVFPRAGSGRDAVAFESHQPVPTQWRRYGAGGALEMSAQFSDHVGTAAGLFPTRMTIEDHLHQKKVEIRYQEPEVNGAIPSELFTQKLPAHVKEVPIEAIGS